jgi:hypothetical protein
MFTLMAGEAGKEKINKNAFVRLQIEFHTDVRIANNNHHASVRRQRIDKSTKVGVSHLSKVLLRNGLDNHERKITSMVWNWVPILLQPSLNCLIMLLIFSNR